MWVDDVLQNEQRKMEPRGYVHPDMRAAIDAFNRKQEEKARRWKRATVALALAVFGLINAMGALTLLASKDPRWIIHAVVTAACAIALQIWRTHPEVRR